MGCVERGVCRTTGVPMSRYGYDYSLTPSRSYGWRSLFRNALTIGAITAISAISGAVVVLDLLGSRSAVADRPVVAAPAQPANLRVARTVTPTASQPASVPTNAAVQQPQATAAAASAAAAHPTAQPVTASAPQASPAPQPVPAASAAPVEEPKTAQVPDRELTFSSGYARRRAVHEAATSGSGTKTEVARVESQTQVGRTAIKAAKPRTTVARQTGPQDQSGPFARADQTDRFDFGRHQALAFGDQRDPRATRRAPSQQQGSSSPGGFFRGLF
jgi:hypothetical protein